MAEVNNLAVEDKMNQKIFDRSQEIAEAQTKQIMMKLELDRRTEELSWMSAAGHGRHRM